ncbi:MAG: acetate--CoA ligase family protein, partial [Nocardioidaceae bacterium]
ELYREQARILAKRANEPGAPVLAMSLTSGDADDTVVGALVDHGVPLLGGATPSLSAIGAFMSWHRAATPSPLVAPDQVVELPWDDRRVLVGKPALDVLSYADIAVPASYVAAEVSTVAHRWKEIGAPVVLKIEARGLAHKSDLGGVVTDISSADELKAAAANMSRSLRDNGHGGVEDTFLVQSQVSEPAVECIVGVVRDPQVGLVLTVAPGGVLAELAGAALTTPVPASAADVDYLIDSSALGRLLDGYRGAPRRDRQALVDLAVAFGRLAASAGPQLESAELNPVMVLPDGNGAVAVDALFVKEES